MLEIVQDSPDDRGTLRVRLEQILDKTTSGQGVASSPEAGCGAQPASDRQVRIPDLIKIGREDELEMSGRKKVPSRGRTIASHLCEHPSLNLARLDRHEHVADWAGNRGHVLDALQEPQGLCGQVRAETGTQLESRTSYVPSSSPPQSAVARKSICPIL